MAWTFLQGKAATPVGTGTSLSVTPTSNLTANSVIVVGGALGGGNTATMSAQDGAGNSYSQVGTKATDGGTSFECGMFAAVNTLGGGTAPSITFKETGVSSVGMAMGFVEASGIQAVADVTTSKNGSTGSASPSVGPTSATTAGSEFAVGLYGNDGFNGAMTHGTGWTDAANSGANTNEQIDLEYRGSGTSGSTVTATWTTSNNTYGAIVAVFKLSGGGGSRQQQLMTMGVGS